MTGFAPAAPPPPAVSHILQPGPRPADVLALTLVHPIEDVSAYVVLVRATAATASVARKPKLSAHRLVRGVGPQSAAALPVSGGVVEFTSTRYSIESGQRYGVQVRVVRVEDGMVSS